MSTSSPGSSVRPIAALSEKLSVVMFWPKEMHSGIRRPEEGGQDFARTLHAAVDFPGRREVAVGVHIAGRVELGDRLDDASRHLAAARAVQKRKLGALAMLLQSRKILPAAQRVLGGVRHYNKS